MTRPNGNIAVGVGSRDQPIPPDNQSTVKNAMDQTFIVIDLLSAFRVLSAVLWPAHRPSILFDMERPRSPSGNSVNDRATITKSASRVVCAGAMMVAICLVPLSSSAAPTDPDWPCQQIKVAGLSLASAWSGPPVDPQQTDWKDDPRVADLVQTLSPRRKPIDQARGMIDNFAREAGDGKQSRLLKLLAGLFTTMDTERETIIAGLDRFGARQKELAAQIRTDNEKLRSMQAERTIDPETVQHLMQQVAWEAELFQDRRQAISYACDAPSKIEQRFFALTRQIQQDLE